MKPQPIGWPTAFLALVVCIFRGGNQVALKFALTAMGPFWTACWRLLIGLVVIGGWAVVRRIPLLPQRGEWRSLAQLSLLFFVQIGFLHFGADHTSPAYAVVLMNSNPIFANLIAHFFVPADRLSASRLAGLGLAFIGVAAVLLGRPQTYLAPNPTLGNLTVLTAAILVAIRIVYTQRVVQTIEPVRTVFWQGLLSLPCFWLVALLVDEGARRPLSTAAVLGVVYQGTLISGLAPIAWATLLRRHSPGSLSVFSFTVPIFGVLFSAWLFGEVVTARLVLGVTAVTAGIALATQAGRKAILAGEDGYLSDHEAGKPPEKPVPS